MKEVHVCKYRLVLPCHTDDGLGIMTQEEFEFFTDAEIPLTTTSQQMTPAATPSSIIRLSREERLAKAKALKRKYEECNEGGLPTEVNLEVPLPENRPKKCKIDIKISFIYYLMLNNCAGNIP